MPLLHLTLALAALLATPGPTNALLAVAGADRGVAPALRLIGVVLIAYGVTVGPLALFGAALLQHLPALRPVVAGVAAIWVMMLAYRIWSHRGAAMGRETVSAGSLFTTTLLNPKALIVGLVLLPAPEPLAPRFAVFLLIVAAISAGWVLLGHLAGRRTGAGAGLPKPLRRITALWLGVLSCLLAASALAP